eukprot:jgi/Mesvir1/29434/Mv23016-RA.1
MGSQETLQANTGILRECKARMDLDLHPARAGSGVMLGIHECLNGMLMRFNDRLGGVLLSYRRERVLADKATILSGMFPYFRVKVVADLVVFAPRVGSMLVGQVNKVGLDFISLLVLGTFNVAISKKDIREDLECDIENEQWASMTDGDHVIGVGCDVMFEVQSVEVDDNFLEIVGSLMAPETGSLLQVLRQRGHEAGATEPPAVMEEETSPSKKAKGAKKRRRTEDGAALNEESEQLAHKKKKKKKEIQADE